MTETDFIKQALEAGQLIYTDTVLDDDPDSPTCGKFIDTFQGTKGLTDEDV